MKVGPNQTFSRTKETKPVLSIDFEIVYCCTYDILCYCRTIILHIEAPISFSFDIDKPNNGKGFTELCITNVRVQFP